ncbi:MAG: response regulator [Nitrospinales bacterium]
MVKDKKNKKESLEFSERTESGSNPEAPFFILIAEDDADDYLLIEEAFAQVVGNHKLVWVKDGEALMHHLSSKNNGRPSDRVIPNLIILDLNMPKISGLEALQEIKSNKKLRRIPIVIFTTSRSEEDVVLAYDLGVNSFIQKPTRFETLVDVIGTLHRYWFKVSKLPTTR